jgi:GntR family transcriptional regulator, transcriptional repressor for pyruvate dehydrogenase complex
MLGTIKRHKIRDVVATQLKAYIAGQGLKPGDRLPTETELASQFGVNRLSIREATKALEFLGVVESKPGRGLTVGQVSLERVTEYLGFHPALQLASPEELIGTRIVLETGVLPYVMRQMQGDPSIYEELREINSALRRAHEVQTWVELDIAFHRRLVESSGLNPLLAFNDLLSVFFQKFRESVKKGGRKAGVESHQRLLDALRAGKLADACEELRQHIESHRERLKSGAIQ